VVLAYIRQDLEQKALLEKICEAKSDIGVPL